MADEATIDTTAATTTATTEQAQTTPPAPGATTASAEPASLAGVPKATHRDQFLAQLSAKRSALSETKTPAPAKTETTTTEKPVESTSPDVASDSKDEPTEDPKAIEAARKLNEIAKAARQLRETRAREANEAKARAEALAAKEREIAQREQAASAKLKALQDAMASGSKVAILRAAGIPDSDIRGTWLFDAMQEAGREDDEPAKHPNKVEPSEKSLTKEDVAALLKEHEEQLRKQQDEESKQHAQQALQARQEAYFGQVQEVYDKGEHPICQAVLAPLGKHAQAFLDDYLTRHYNTTGQAMTAKELLDSIEETYKGRGVAVAKAKPSKVEKPSPPPPAAASRTITQAATAGVESDGSAQVKRDKTMHEVREEGWKATERRLAERRAARHV